MVAVARRQASPVAIAVTAIGSAGDSTAASAKAAGKGSAGTGQMDEQAHADDGEHDQTDDEPDTARRFLKSSSDGMRQPSRNNRVGNSRIEKTCGSSVTAPVSVPYRQWRPGGALLAFGVDYHKVSAGVGRRCAVDPEHPKMGALVDRLLICRVE